MKKTRISSYVNGKKQQVNSRNPMTDYWMKEEVFAHDCRLVFPDWSYLAMRGLERIKRNDAEHYQRRKGKAVAQKKEYRQRPEVKARHAELQRRKKSTDPGFRVRRNLSRRMAEIMTAARNPKAGASIMVTVGCSQEDLRRHIERQFKPWMTWANYGTKWQVDHILPCSSFDHNDPSQVAICWHWTNLRPLKSEDNAAKKDKITQPQISLAMNFH